MIAALFVQKNGVYFGVPKVDPWPQERDARTYSGPHPVIAHPPCERWGRYWSGGPNPHARRRQLGDDGGCFAAALAAVRRCGGVLEHPADSHAWSAFGLPPPPPRGWQRDVLGGWCCRVEQAHYGHRARKPTWLYFVGAEPTPMIFGRFLGRIARLDHGFHTTAERRAAGERGRISRGAGRLRSSENRATPIAFRDALIALVHPLAKPSLRQAA